MRVTRWYSPLVERLKIAEVLRTLETIADLEWAESDAARAHLYKRLDQGDLTPGAALEGYEDLIREVVRSPDSRVYLDPDDTRNEGAIAITRDLGERGQWLVKVHGDVTIRTAFRVSSPGDAYVDDQGYDYIGTIREVLQ